MSLENDCPYGVNDCPKLFSIKDRLVDMSKKQDDLIVEVSNISRVLKDCAYVITIAVALICAYIGAKMI